MPSRQLVGVELGGARGTPSRRNAANRSKRSTRHNYFSTSFPISTDSKSIKVLVNSAFGLVCYWCQTLKDSRNIPFSWSTWSTLSFSFTTALIFSHQHRLSEPTTNWITAYHAFSGPWSLLIPRFTWSLETQTRNKTTSILQNRFKNPSISPPQKASTTQVWSGKTANWLYSTTRKKSAWKNKSWTKKKTRWIERKL